MFFHVSVQSLKVAVPESIIAGLGKMLLVGRSVIMSMNVFSPFFTKKEFDY